MFTGPGGRRSYEVADPSRQFRGGYGVVFHAEVVDDHLGAHRRGHKVSLKQLSGVDDDRWEKLVSRSPELARIAHPGLAAHLEVFHGQPLAPKYLDPAEQTLRWTVNAWVDGQVLAETDLHMPARAVFELFAGAAAAIDVLHGAGVAHRDLHPRNLIVTGDGRLVVIDFDTAFTARSRTTTRIFAGTQFTAEMPEPARADPYLADNVAFARCVVHALADDGDGVLDEGTALELALRRTQPQVADPNPFGRPAASWARWHHKGMRSLDPRPSGSGNPIAGVGCHGGPPPPGRSSAAPPLQGDRRLRLRCCTRDRRCRHGERAGQPARTAIAGRGGGGNQGHWRDRRCTACSLGDRRPRRSAGFDI